MSYKTATSAMKQMVVDNIGTIPLANIGFPNQPFDPPDRSIYAKLHVIYDTREDKEIGGSMQGASGRCVVEVVSPQDVSTEEHDDVCDEFFSIFSGVDVGSLRFDTGRVRTVGISLGKYRSEVVVSFTNYVEV